MANQYVNKVEYGSDTLIDLTSDTVTASTLLSGYTAHDRSGAPIVGVAVSGGYTVNFSTTNPDLYGATITIKQGSTVIGTVAFDNTGSASYTLSNPGTYTWSVTLEGETYTDTFVISTPEVYIETTFVYRDWLIAGGLNPSDYADLSDVLADEDAVRQLMTIHAAVDYLASFESTDASVVTILNDNYAAKWISLTDYAMDVLEAAYGTLMGTIGKYGYGEWGITDATTTPPTWGALGNVPVMTSNTAPYGEAISNSTYQNYYPWCAFSKGGSSLPWAPSQTGTTTNTVWLGYKFTNPVDVRKFSIDLNVRTSGEYVVKIQSSNTGDSADWHDASENITIYSGGQSGRVTYDGNITGAGFYLYWRVFFVTANPGASAAVSADVYALQFYGRTLRVSVPKMSGNTTPYGEVISTSLNNNPPYKVFDKTNNGRDQFSTYGNNRQTVTGEPKYVGYSFVSPVRVKAVMLRTIYDNQETSHSDPVSIQYSDDATTWETDTSFIIGNENKTHFVTITEDEPHRHWRAYMTGANLIANPSGGWMFAIDELDFFGVDYTEREWDTTHPRRYLYDHGVEVETLTAYTESANAEKKPSELKFALTGTANSIAEFYAGAIDFTDYSLMRAAAGDTIIDLLIMRIATATPYTASMHNNSSNYVATVTVNASDGSLPENLSLDLSSVSGTYNAVIYVAVGSASGSYRTGTIKELWLE